MKTTSQPVTITAFSEIHYPEIARIYKAGISTGIATLETKIPTWESWDKTHLVQGRVMAILDNQIAGWAALSPVSGRCVYSGVAEVSIYIDPDFKGLGIGTQLLSELIAISENNNIWTLQAGIFKENKISQRLHSKCGFREVGYREKISCLNGEWKDIVLMERRSKLI